MYPLNCPFCREFCTGTLEERADVSFDSRVLLETPNFLVVPDISPLAPGHVMIVPKSHITAFGSLDEQLMNEALSLSHIVKRTLKRYYGPSVVLEHGTNSSNVGGGCVSHAHLHFFPRAIDLASSLRPYRARQISDFRELSRWALEDKAYVYFESHVGEKYVADNLAGIPRQFIRIEIARSIGLRDPLWNWREHILLENLEATFHLLSTADWSAA